MAKVRIYKPFWTKVWTVRDIITSRDVVVQYEYSYTEIDTESGNVVGMGTEDFSPERYRREVVTRWIYTWDGTRRNKGGHRWFDDRGRVTYRRTQVADVREYYRNRYQAAEVQLRS